MARRIEEVPTLRELVEARASKGRSETQRPRTVAWVAKRCRISDVYLGRLMSGQRPVGSDALPPWTEARLAIGLEVERDVVRAAVKRTREEARAAEAER